MSTLTKFTVKSSNLNKQGRYVIKLSADVTVFVFGQTKTIKRTFYIGGMTQSVAIGTVLEEDLSKFDITERKVAMVDDGIGKKTPMDIDIAQKAGATYEVYSLKWLQAKVA